MTEIASKAILFQARNWTLLLFLSVATMPLWAQNEPPPPAMPGKADTDGPHLFYRKNKIHIKQVVMQDTTAVAKIDSIDAKQKDKLLIECRFTKNPEWNFTTRLKAKHKVENTEYPKAEKILAVSDIEGNFGTFRNFLVSHKVIDEKYNWTFGKGHLVCVGDFFDRGVNVTECLWLIYDLEEKAKAAGGYVHFILGNHEILNMSNDFRYVQPKYMRNADLFHEPYGNWYKSSSELGRWLSTKNVVERIGDLIFVHGGLAPDLTAAEKSLADLNSTMRPFYFISEDVFRMGDEVLQFLYDANGPLWNRSYVMNQVSEAQVDELLHKFSGKRIIVGHTLVSMVRGFYNGKVIAIDTRHVDPNSTALLYEGGKFFRIDQQGKRGMLNLP
jgi:hypothetical protein